MTDLTNPQMSPITNRSPANDALAASALTFESTSYVEWPTIIAGGIAAMAVVSILLTFGLSVGLSVVSPWSTSTAARTSASVGAAFWMLLTNVWAFGLGGYLASRMRHRRTGASINEVEFRDGAHGVLAWALAVVVSGLIGVLLTAIVSSGGASNTLSSQATPGPINIAVDSMLRSPKAANDARSEEVRGEVTRLLSSYSGKTPLVGADRTYLVELVATRTGLPQAQAEARVDTAVVQMADSINRARKVSVIAGFMAAASLLLGAAAAWWGASVGGKHRDEGTLWAGFSRHEF